MRTERKVLVPRRIRSLTQATKRQLRLRELLQKYENLELQRRARMAAIEDKFVTPIEKIKAQIEKLVRPFITYVESHRTVLSGGTPDASKVRLEGGSFEWSPGKDFVDIFDEKKALESILELEKAHPDIVRRSVEINKQYLHDHPELIKQLKGVRWSKRPAHVLRFDDTNPRIEHSENEDSITIVIPKQKK
jgi:phage host-nuclease inhibitor protein Gam